MVKTVLGVELFDEVAVAIVNDLAFDFQRRGELAAVDGELIRQERHAADALVVNQLGGQPGDVALHDLDRSWILAQRVAVLRHVFTRFCKRLLQAFPFRDDQRHRLLPAGPNHHHLTHKLALFQKTLDQLWRDIFPVRKLEQIFLAIGDV